MKVSEIWTNIQKKRSIQSYKKREKMRVRNCEN